MKHDISEVIWLYWSDVARWREIKLLFVKSWFQKYILFAKTYSELAYVHNTIVIVSIHILSNVAFMWN